MDITTHVLDTSAGKPAAGVRVVLERGGKSSEWQVVGHGVTSADGRVETLTPESTALDGGIYRLVYDTRRYFEEKGVQTFFPSIIITFQVESNNKGRGDHYHIPLLLSPFGYTSYRGS